MFVVGSLRWPLVQSGTIRRTSGRISSMKALTLASARRIQCASTKVLSTVATSDDDDKVADDPSLKVVLYQYAICPFCNQVKAVLDYTATDYRAVEVNPLTKAQIKWSEQYRKVPIAKINNSPVFGSDNIINKLLVDSTVRQRLQTKWATSNSKESDAVTNMENFTSSTSQKWKDFAVNDLAPLLYPNMCRTWSDAYQAFEYVNSRDEFSALQRVAIRSIGSLAMYMAASRVKKKRNITDERKALDDILSQLEVEGLLNGNNKFLSGRNEPDLGDLTVYGTLCSIEGLPAHNIAVYERKQQNGSPAVLSDWYERVKAKVKKSSSV